MSALATFRSHADSVRRLMNFDRDLIGFALKMVGDLDERLKAAGFENPHLNAESAVRALRQVRDNDSLRPRYQTIFNQSLVLLVSYFASALHELFSDSVRSVGLATDSSELFNEEVKISIRELRDAGADFAAVVPEILIKTKDISFQDMQSIARAFKTYANVTVPRDARVNDIILAQAARHVIVHNGGIIDPKFIRQVASATPRHVMQSVDPGVAIQFAPEWCAPGKLIHLL
ncbi:MAG: hypothetical protein H0W20_11740 [Chthoniobacterales bacterium]|nr:hypothetical protein [Chthoniobacterales bacterium]